MGQLGKFKRNVISVMMRNMIPEKDGGWSRFMHIKTIEEDVLIHGNPTLSVRVNILETRGCGKEKLRDFDESAQEFSDVVILVKDQKFYLNKKFLAFQSSYFKSLLLGNFEESQKTEIKLEGIDPEDFQNFLELIHGESAIEDINVAGILRLADMYDSPVAIRRCAEFLENSSVPREYKQGLAEKYRLPEKREVKDLWSLDPTVDIPG